MIPSTKYSNRNLQVVVCCWNFCALVIIITTENQDFAFQYHQFVKGDTTSTSAAPKVESSTASPVEPNKPTTVEKVTDVKSETAVKTPKKELNGKKWIIEYQKGSLVTVHGTAEQRIYVFDCQG